MSEGGRHEKVQLWAGRAASGLVAVFLIFDALAKVFKVPSSVEEVVAHGFSEKMVVPIGIVWLICAILYAIPKTSVLGAVLLTVLIGEVLSAHIVLTQGSIALPVVVGILVWGGLWLRDRNLRACFPLRGGSG
jgi:hypothetical protein